LLSTPGGGGGAGRDMPDGRRPEPGGWNRIQIEVEDLARMVVTLKQTGAKFRNDIVTGNGGRQILLEDPAGNPIELFEPARR
jgi:predicted enzyme related to lactoylglutathione lyase